MKEKEIGIDEIRLRTKETRFNNFMKPLGIIEEFKEQELPQKQSKSKREYIDYDVARPCSITRMKEREVT